MRWYQHEREIILNYIIFICCDLTFILCTNSDLSPATSLSWGNQILIFFRLEVRKKKVLQLRKLLCQSEK